jgi:hypothetical protein
MSAATMAPPGNLPNRYLPAVAQGDAELPAEGDEERVHLKPVATDRLSDEALDKVAGGASIFGRSAKETK